MLYLVSFCNLVVVYFFADYDWSSDSSYEITLFDTLLCFAWLGVLVFIKVVMWKPPSTDQVLRMYFVLKYILNAVRALIG